MSEDKTLIWLVTMTMLCSYNETYLYDITLVQIMNLLQNSKLTN